MVSIQTIHSANPTQCLSLQVGVSIILYNHHILLSALDGHYFAELICGSEEEKKRLIVEVSVT